jgi:hypothetical protein
MEPITEHLDHAAIHSIAAKYGPCLEKLTNSQKLDVMGILSLWVSCCLEDEDDIHWRETGFDFEETSASVEDILDQCDDLAPDEALVFITAIAYCVTV